MATQDRLATGDGTTDDWNALGGGSKFSEVDDPIGSPDDDTTYVFATTNNLAQRFSFAAFAINSISVDKVRVTYRHKKTTGFVSTAAQIKVNGVAYTGTGRNRSAWTTDIQDWLTNPNTGAAWLEADVEGTGANPLQEFGVNGASVDAGEEARCTQVYATVTFVAAGVGNPWHVYAQQ